MVALKRVGEWRWLPGAVLVAATIVALRFFGVSLPEMLVFSGYVVAGITVPGLLLWRFLRGGASVFVTDVAAGTAVGYAVEVLLYIGARWIGVPWLVAAFPVVTIAAFVAVPSLRRFWRGSRDEADRPPLWYSWSIAAVLGTMLLWTSTRFFRQNSLAWPFVGALDDDSPFHLALLGDARHHMPLSTPWVLGEPVLYHWFVYAEMAATSWMTGIEPQVLLLRLSLVPMIAGFTVLVAAITRRLTGRWWAGAVAAAATFFVLAPNPYQWQLDGWFTVFATSPYEDGSAFRLVLWTSPTHTFGAMLFAALVYVLVGLLSGRVSRGRWALFALLAVVMMGAKATFLPVLFAGLLLVAAVEFLRHRRLHRTTLWAAGITLACLIFTQIVLFGGASQGLAFDPLQIMEISGAPYTTLYTAATSPWWTRVVALLITLACWACIWAGCVGLLRQRRFLEPPILALLGMGLAGMGAILILGEPSGAAAWFFNAVRPYLVIAAVVGLAMLVGQRRLTRRELGWLLGALVAGLAVAYVVRRVGTYHVPSVVKEGLSGVTLHLVLPYVALLLPVVVVWLGLRTRRFAALTELRAAIIVIMLIGLGLFASLNMLKDSGRDAIATGFAPVARPPVIAEGVREAGRWLRDHSSPDDLVATNVHCYNNVTNPCDARHFALSAYSERRFLVEGWSFTARAHDEARAAGTTVSFVPYWKPDVLADNDAVFTDPSPRAVETLREAYGVRWLFADLRLLSSTDEERLAQVATLRFQHGDAAIYELPAD